MEKYKFVENPQKPGYLNVIDPVGNLVAEFWQESALVTITMYENMYKRNPRLGNEFLYGYILGMTHALMYADRYPKFTIIKNGNETLLKVVDPILGEVFNGEPRNAPGATKIGEAMLDKALNSSKEN